jgi:hypothetical protein
VERPTVPIDLDLPVDQRFDAIPAELFAAGERLLAAVRQMAPPAARWLSWLVRLRTFGRFQREARSLARLIHADWRELILANITYDLVIASFGCSTVALPTPRGPVLARNMDWWPEDVLAQTSCLVQFRSQGELRFANAGWPGAIGVVSGMSGRGFAVVLNAVIGPERHSKLGYPVLLHLRRVLEDAADFDAALAMLRKQRLAAPALLTLVGTENRQRVVVERTPTRHALRWPRGDEPLVATNDYRLLLPTETHAGSQLYQTTCSRYDALCAFFADHRPDRDVEDSQLLYVLSDPRVIQDITAQHVIMRPRTQQVGLWVPRRLVEADLEPSAPPWSLSR